MKIFFALRLYTGLEKSMESSVWSPTGIPTIYKLLEAIDQKHQIIVFLLHKIPTENQYTKYKQQNDKIVKFEQFKEPFNVISSLGKKSNKIVRFLNEIIHCIKIIFNIKKESPDLIYFDHSNIWTAGIVSRIFNIPVVVRLLGIYPYINALSNKRLTINQYILRWSYKGPYSLVVNTNDGSGKNNDVIKLLNNNTDYKLLLNGVDQIKNKQVNNLKDKLNIVEGSVVCLFIGKLEIYKGCITFVQAVINALQKGIEVHGIMIGEGSQSTEIINIINKSKFKSNFSLIGNINHNDIFNYHQISDLYISLNHLGNLSNTNLEAVKFGQVIILPKKLFTDTDGEDTKLLGEDNILWIENPNDVEGIVNYMQNIHLDKNYLNKYKKNILNVAKLIPSWDERINKEIKLLEKLIEN